MRGAVVAALLLVAACDKGTGAPEPVAEPVKWREFRPAEANIAVELPGTPERREEITADIPETFYNVKDRLYDLRYTVAVARFPPDVIPFDKGIDHVLSRGGRHSIHFEDDEIQTYREDRVQVGDVPALDVRCTVKSPVRGLFGIRTRVLVLGTSMVTVGVAYNLSDADHPDVEHMFASLRVLD